MAEVDTELDLAWVADHQVISAVARRLVLEAADTIDALRASADDVDRVGRDAVEKKGGVVGRGFGAAFAIGWLEGRLKAALEEIESLKARERAANAESYQIKTALHAITEALPGYEAQALAKTNGDAQHWDTSDTVEAALAAIGDLHADADVKSRERAARVDAVREFVKFVVASEEFNNGDFYADGKVDESDLDALAERFTSLEGASDGE